MGAGRCIIVETEYHPARTLSADVDRALQFDLRECGRPAVVIGAILPERAAELETDGEIDDLLMECDGMQYYVKSPDGSRFPASGYLRGSAIAVRNAARLSSAPSEQVDVGYRHTVAGMEMIVDLLSRQPRHVRDSICGILGQDPDGYTWNMAALVMINAAVFHNVLSQRRGDVAPIPPAHGLHPPTRDTFLGAWMGIRGIDYAPVFDSAMGILSAVPPEPAARIAEILADTSERVVGSGSHWFGDFLGMLYQRQLYDRKRVAAFYTRPEAAALLSGLTMDGCGGEVWKDPERVCRLRIADFACGSGSLLRAAYAHMIHCSPGDLSEHHAAIMEGCLYGFDIYPTATHFTVSALSYMHHDVTFDMCRIYTLPIGVSEGRRRIDLGSLDLIWQHEKFDVAGRRHGGRGARDVGDVTIQSRSCDYIVMNPPYARTTDHGDHRTDAAAPFAAFGATPDDQRVMTRRNNRIFVGTCADGNAGLASHFLAICNEKIRAGGRMGIILPGTVVSGDGWGKVRAMINEWYDDVMVVAAGGRSMSADTSIHEVMLVATRRENGRAGWKEYDSSLRIKFVQLDRLPASELEAREIARQVRSSPALRIEDGGGPSLVRVGNDICGRMMDCPAMRGAASGGEDLAAQEPRRRQLRRLRRRQGSGGGRGGRGGRAGSAAPPWPYRRVTDMSMWHFAYCLAHNMPLPAPPMAGAAGPLMPHAAPGGDGGGGADDGGGGATIRVAQLASLGRVGLVHRDIVGDEKRKDGTPRGPFRTAPYRDGGHLRLCLWGNDNARQKQMVVDPDTILEQKPGATQGQARRVMRTASRVHLNNQVGYGAQRLIAAYTDKPTVGGSAWPNVILNDESHEKAVTAWCNSTLGMLLYWSVAGDQQPGRGRMGVAAFSKSFPVLDTSALEAGQIADMTALFDDMRGAELLPLNAARRDPVRKTVDEGILAALGVDMDMRAIYRWVSGERQFHTSHTAVH